MIIYSPFERTTLLVLRYNYVENRPKLRVKILNGKKVRFWSWEQHN